MRNLKKEVWPYQIQLRMPDVTTVKELLGPDEWCTRIVGRRFVDWYSYNFADTKNTRIYAFRDEETLLVFKLAWGNYVNH